MLSCRGPGGLLNQPEVCTVTKLPDQVDRDVVVIGGCGHVGLPLALAFADRGARVGIYDVSQTSVDMVNTGQMPFAEPGADDMLHRVLAAGSLEASADPAIVATAEHVVVVIGTPVDEHLNPNQTAITKALSQCAGYLRDGQLLILRSTVFPGVTALVEKMVAGLGLLPVETMFEADKVVRWTAGQALGVPVRGYEIRHGRTRSPAPWITTDRPGDGDEGCQAAGGRISGTSLHGLTVLDAIVPAIDSVANRDDRGRARASDALRAGTRHHPGGAQ